MSACLHVSDVRVTSPPTGADVAAVVSCPRVSMSLTSACRRRRQEQMRLLSSDHQRASGELQARLDSVTADRDNLYDRLNSQQAPAPYTAPSSAPAAPPAGTVGAAGRETETAADVKREERHPAEVGDSGGWGVGVNAGGVTMDRASQAGGAVLW